MTLEKVLYRTHATATGGRNGHAVIPENNMRFTLSEPHQTGSGNSTKTNPEQLFAAAYSACFLGAMKFVAARDNIEMPADAKVDAHIALGPVVGGFGIEAELKVSLPRMDRHTARSLIDNADLVCPYSNATRGNVKVTLTLV